MVSYQTSLHCESSATRRSRVLRAQSVKVSMQALSNFLVLGKASRVSATNWKDEENKPLQPHQNKLYTFQTP
jgi:hypothetical protein